jgi:hypothetical protein
VLPLLVPSKRFMGAGRDIRGDAEAEARVGNARSAKRGGNTSSDRCEGMLSYSTKQ